MNWTLYNLRGPRDQVKAKIAAAKDVPDPDKAYLQGRIDGLPAECFAVGLNAYSQTHVVGNDEVTNLSVTLAGYK